MGAIPRDRVFDASLDFAAEGYLFILNRCRRFRSDVFETRLMLSKVFCALGEEAAGVFYTPGRFTRRRAMPRATLRLLQGHGSVVTLDGEAHRHRKAMFMSLMTPESIGQLKEKFVAQWERKLDEWTRRPGVRLHSEAEEILCRAACEWAGVPLAESDAARRTHEFAAMIDGAATFGPRSWVGLVRRRCSEGWMGRVIADIRAGRLNPPESSAARVIATHTDDSGRLLDARVAMFELMNVLRPTVAVARYITFAAHALNRHSEWRGRLAGGDETQLEWFANEVRRFFPLFPVVAGRVVEPFEWRGRRFDRGEWFMLDLYGTSHDSRIWKNPNRFDPERFRDWTGDPLTLIPQGGGDFNEGHRCAGEWITIELIKAAVRLLASGMEYKVPPQDLRIDLTRIPAIPVSRFVMTNVRRA